MLTVSHKQVQTGIPGFFFFSNSFTVILSLPQIPKWKPDYEAPVKVLIYLWEGGISDPHLPVLPFPWI